MERKVYAINKGLGENVYIVDELIVNGDSYKVVIDLCGEKVSSDGNDWALFTPYGDGDIKVYNPLEDPSLVQPKQNLVQPMQYGE